MNGMKESGNVPLASRVWRAVTTLVALYESQSCYTINIASLITQTRWEPTHESAST